jgi:AraC-like DNA-binding protein
MKAQEITLPKDDRQSFIFYHETNPFSRWHYHPEYELVLIIKGEGKRMIGDNINRFEAGDLVFLGSYLPHQWHCEDSFYTKGGFKGEAVVIQFLDNFLGDNFFNIQENKKLKKFLSESARGSIFSGKSKDLISKIMTKMIGQESDERLFSLFEIFKILGFSHEYQLLASPNFNSNYQSEKSSPMKKVIEFIMLNFHHKIKMKKMLEIANMSSTTFSVTFKKDYNMTFSEYVLKVRIGYACGLLTDNDKSISQISLDAGFENLSNFNRLFKKIKGATPKEFRKEALATQSDF